MKPSIIIRIVVYSLAILIPILSMVNCTGWGTNDMKVDQCYIDSPVLRELSETSYAILFFSCYMFGLPIAFYFGAVLLIVEIPLLLFSTDRRKKFVQSIIRTISSTQDKIKKENISPFVIIPFIALAFILWYIIDSL